MVTAALYGRRRAAASRIRAETLERQVTAYESWLELCNQYDTADREMRAALAVVTVQIKSDESRGPAADELAYLERAKERVFEVRDEMNDFIARQFNR